MYETGDESKKNESGLDSLRTHIPLRKKEKDGRELDFALAKTLQLPKQNSNSLLRDASQHSVTDKERYPPDEQQILQRLEHVLKGVVSTNKHPQ